MSVQISTYIYDPAKGRDVPHNTPIDYDGSKYKTCEEAAKALHEVLKAFAVKCGMHESEVALFTPEQTQNYSGNSQWCVVWEAGPHDWAIGTSMQISGPWGHCEPYYGFDLHFTE